MCDKPCDGNCEGCQCGNLDFNFEEFDALVTLFRPYIEAEFHATLDKIREACPPEKLEEINAEIESYVVDTTTTLVESWVGLLFIDLITGEKLQQLDISTLNEAMLRQDDPYSPFTSKIFLEIYFEREGYECEIETFGDLVERVEMWDRASNLTINILRKVRASLPDGKKLPDEAVELLRLNGVQVIL